jgi:multiple sugar transport system substrate-binding protein
VPVGLAIPKGAQNEAGAEALIEWLTRPAQQAAASASLSFFPVVQNVGLAGAQAAERKVANSYRADRQAVETLQPAGLGSRGNDFTTIYQDTFKRIILNSEDIRTVLDDEVGPLQKLIDDAQARCWPPDPVSRGPCQIG